MNTLQKIDAIVQDVVAGFNDPDKKYAYEAFYYNELVGHHLALRLAGIGGLVKDHEGVIAEVGTDSGFGALTLAAVSSAHVYSCDTRQESIDVATARAKRLGITNVTFIHGDVHELVKATGNKIAFGYVDGCHTFDQCLEDLETLAVHTHTYGSIAIDDCGPWFEPYKATMQFMKNHPEWTGTLLQGGFLVIGRLPA